MEMGVGSLTESDQWQHLTPGHDATAALAVEQSVARESRNARYPLEDISYCRVRVSDPLTATVQSDAA